MSLSRILGITVAANVAISTMLGLFIWKENRALALERADYRKRLAEVNTAAARLRVEIRQRTDARAASRSDSNRDAHGQAGAATAESKPAPDTEATGAAGSAARARLETQRILATDTLRNTPEYAAYLTRNARREVSRRYGDAIEALHLPTEKAERLKQLLTEQELGSSDATAIAQRQGEPVGGSAEAQVRRQIATTTDEAIRELLGQDEAAEFRAQVEFQSFRRDVIETCNAALAEKSLPALDSDRIFVAARGQQGLPTVSPKSRDEWANLIRSRLNAAMTSEQLEVFIEHTYAWMRQRRLRIEITRQVANANG